MSGRISSRKGLGIVRRGRVRLFDTSTGIERARRTNQRGFYQFGELEIGRFFIVRAESQNFTFASGNYFLELTEDRAEVSFTGERLFLKEDTLNSNKREAVAEDYP